jgi:hypothetical protein
MRPIPISNREHRILLLIQAGGPAKIRSPVPIVGATAHHPGKTDALVRECIGKKIKNVPMIDATLHKVAPLLSNGSLYIMATRRPSNRIL